VGNVAECVRQVKAEHRDCTNTNACEASTESGTGLIGSNLNTVNELQSDNDGYLRPQVPPTTGLRALSTRSPLPPCEPPVALAPPPEP
jgi:hypothetical protein